LLAEGGHSFVRVACAEGLEEEDAAVVYFVDDGFDAREVGVGFFGAVTDLFFELPGDSVRD
jgi:hypothetical protein